MTVVIQEPESTTPSAATPPVAPAYSSDNPEADAKALAAADAAIAAHETPEVTPPAEEAPAEEQAEEQVGAVDYAKYSAELNEGGALSDESYAELEAKGFPREVVDTYVRGIQASTENAASEILSTIGGADQYAKISAWAQATLSESDLADYNAAVSNPASARFAVKALAERYASSEGSEPRLVKPSSSNSRPDSAAFESSAQMVAAMRDPRYKTDSAYRSQVQDRLARANY